MWARATRRWQHVAPGRHVVAWRWIVRDPSSIMILLCPSQARKTVRTLMNKLALCLLSIALTGTVNAQTMVAPGLISIPDSGDAFGTLSPNNREFYFTRYKEWALHRIMVSRFQNGKWSAPETVPFSGRFTDREP